MASAVISAKIVVPKPCMRATSGEASTGEVHSAYDQMAQAVPQGTLTDSISDAFKSDQTPPFEQMVSGLFGQSNPDQKAGLLNQLLGSLGPGGGSQVLSSMGLGGLAGAVAGAVDAGGPAGAGRGSRRRDRRRWRKGLTLAAFFANAGIS